MLTLLLATALADIPPPPDYVETCTVAQACGGREGVLCGDSYFGDREACATKWSPEGYEKACQTAGASTWDEVWCKPGEAPPAEPATAEPTPAEPASAEPAPAEEPAPANTSRCSAIALSPWAAGLVLPMVALLLRRRRS